MTFFFLFFLSIFFLCDLFLTVKEAHLVLLQKKKIIENAVDIVLMSTCLTGCPTRRHCWLALKRSQHCRVSLGCVGFDPIAEPTQPTHLGWVCQLNRWVTEARPLSGRPLPDVELPVPSNPGQPGNGSPGCDCTGERTHANSGNHAVV
jgi:hypothetical protein